MTDPINGEIVESTWASNIRALIDAILLLGKNETLTYKTMSELIGKPVSGNTSEYQMARTRLSRDHRVEVRTIPRIGALRLDDGGIVEELPKDRASIHRKTRRSLRRAANVEDYSKLNHNQKHEHDRHLATLGLIQHLDEPAVGRAIDDRVSSGLKAIDVQKLIDTLRE